MYTIIIRTSWKTVCYKSSINKVKNGNDQKFHKINSKRRSINSNIYHLPEVKTNQDIKLVNRYETLHSDYKSSETEDTSSNGGSEISTDTSSSSIQKG